MVKHRCIYLQGVLSACSQHLCIRYTDALLFWLITFARYVLSAFVAFLLSIAISFAVILPFAKDNSPGLGFLCFMVLIPVASLLIPLSLGTTAELIQRKVLSRRFKWANALLRSLAALPIAAGPVYAATSVFPYVESRRPTHWVEKEIFLYGLSAAFAYLALHIKTRPPQSVI